MKQTSLMTKLIYGVVVCLTISLASALSPVDTTHAADANTPANSSTSTSPAPKAAGCNVLPDDICAAAKDENTAPKDSGVFKVLVWVLNFLTGVVGIVAVATLVYAGILYSSAGGDSGQVSKAKTLIRDTIIGVVAYGLMFLALNWLIPGGVIG